MDRYQIKIDFTEEIQVLDTWTGSRFTITGGGQVERKEMVALAGVGAELLRMSQLLSRMPPVSTVRHGSSY